MNKHSGWKKGLALLLVFVMAGSMVGCTPAEEAYLKLVGEQVLFEGAHLDAVYIVEFDQNNEWMGQFYGGQPYYELRVVGDMQMDGTAADVEVMYRLSNQGAYLPLARVMQNETTLCLSTEGSWRLIKQQGMYPEKSSPEYLAEIDAYIAAHPFVVFDLTELAYAYHMASKEDYAAQLTDELVEKALPELEETGQLLSEYIKDLSTGLVSDKASGYELRLDVDSVLAAGDAFVKHMQANKEVSYAIGESYDKIYQKLNDVQEISMPSRAEWDQTIDELAVRWAQAREEIIALDIDPQDHISHWIKDKTADGQQVIEHDGELFIAEWGITGKCHAVLTEKEAVAVVPTPNAIDMETFTAGVDAINAKYTTYKGISLEPDSEAEFAVAYVYQDFCGQQDDDWTEVGMKYIDDQYYLAAEDLEWLLPQSARVQVEETQVTIAYQGRTVTLAAVTEEETPYEEALAVYAEMGYEWEPWKTTYVAVRDLTALGFEVSYESHPERISLTPAGQN